MSDKPISAYEARLEVFMARCALDSLKARDASLDADDPGLFFQTAKEDIADIEAALKTLRAYVAQQDPDGEAELFPNLPQNL